MSVKLDTVPDYGGYEFERSFTNQKWALHRYMQSPLIGEKFSRQYHPLHFKVKR